MEGNKVQEETSIKGAELETELASIKQKLAEKELEGRKLQEENERLAQQTQKISEAAPVNGHSEASSSGEDWREKFESLQQEHETIVASLTKQKVSQAERESEVCRYREEVD